MSVAINQVHFSNKPFQHSNNQCHRVEVRVDKNTSNVHLNLLNNHVICKFIHCLFIFIYLNNLSFCLFIFSHLKCDRLKDLVAEHLDHLHYLHDILSLNIQDVNDVLTGHFINRLLIPLYIYSLVRKRPDIEQVNECVTCSLQFNQHLFEA